MIDNIENTIIQTLLTNSLFFNKVFSHLKETHFQSIENIEVFKKIQEYYSEYKEHPKPKEVGLMMKNIKQDKLRSTVVQHFKYIMTSDKIHNLDFIVQEAEKYVQKMEFTRAILEGADAIQNDKDLTNIYGLIGDALKISFDANIGLNFSDDLERRLDYYKRKIQGKETGVKELDDILGGGFRNKTLNIVGSVSHGGKSVFLSAYAAHRTLMGDDGLFYTLEMPEEETSKRVDANIFDLDINLFSTTPNSVFEEKLVSIKHKLGNLVIKEYPAGYLDVLKLEAHLNEYYLKYGKYPAYICVDYLTLMKSARANIGNTNTYSFYKLVAEELHSLAKRYNIPIISASQINRQGFNNKDAGMENISDSIGIAQTADTFFILVRTKELDNEGQVIFNFVKNRNTGILGTCLVGVDFPRMRFYSLEQIAGAPIKAAEKFDNFENYASMFE